MLKDQDELFDEDLVEDDYSLTDELTDDDYGLIISSDGNLKLIYLPTGAISLPKHIIEILQILGVDNPEEIYGNAVKTTIH